MPVSLGDPYGLPNNMQAHFTAGAYFLRRGNRTLRDTGLDYLDDGRVLVNRSGRPRFSAADEDPRSGFGRVAPQQARPFKLFLDQGVHFPNANLRARVQIILPEIIVTTRRQPERYRLVLHLQKAPQAPNAWQVASRDLVRIEAGDLARLVEASATNSIMRLCAANWLLEADPERGRETLARVGRTLQEGPLLLTILQLLTARKGPGLEEHALRLLQDARVPSGMRGWAALYLGVLRSQPAYQTLVKTAGDSRDLAAIGAIHGLGAYGPAAAGALLDLLGQAPAGQNSLVGTLIADNLVLTGARTPTIASTLWQLVEKDNRPALQALVKSGYPETFANLQKRARTERRPDWKGAIAAALLEADPERAVPEVLEMLRQDEPPPENKVLLPDDLVRVLQGWYSTQALVGLLELTREGNLRAVQVLAGMPHDAALAALIGVVRSGTETQVFIALDGLAQRWRQQSVRIFRDALKHPNKYIVLKAIEELGYSGDPSVASWLSPFRTNSDQDLRTAAERALEKLTGGKTTP
jgi:HEAT repeat protein